MDVSFSWRITKVSVLEIQTFQGLDKPEASQQQERIIGEVPLAYPSMVRSTATELNEGILNKGEPVDMFDVIEDGIHAPAPVSTWPETGLELEQPESSRAQARKRRNPSSSQIDETVEPSGQAYNQAPSRKKRHRTVANVKETKELVFQLFMSERAPQEYILEKYEVETGKYKQCRLLGCGEHGQWNVKVSKSSGGEHATLPVLQDPCPAVFYEKYKLGLQDRLRGWSVEQRARGSGMKDKFYYHMGRQFRSLVEVGKYILYSIRQKDLKQLRPERPQDVQEADAVEVATLGLSSEPDSSSAENLNMNSQPKEIEIPTGNAAAKDTMNLLFEPDNGSGEDLKVDSPPKDIESSTVVVEPRNKSGGHDIVDSRNPSAQQSVSSEEKNISDTDYNVKNNEPTAAKAVGPPKGSKDDIFSNLPEIENLDIRNVTQRQTIEEWDDVFSNLLEIENLEIRNDHQTFEKEDDIFSNLPEIENLDNTNVESPHDQTFEEEDDIFSSILEVENLHFFNGF